MRGIAIAGLLLVAGCDVVFGLHHTLPPDASEAAPDTLAMNCRVSDPLPTSADTYLVDTTPRGGADAMLITQDHPGLLKFITTGIVLSNETIVAATVRLELVNKSVECGPACAACPAQKVTKYSVFWMTDAWSQNFASSTNSENNTKWEADYAMGPTDRSPLVFEGDMPADVQGLVDLGIPEAAVLGVPIAPLYFSGDRLAIQLRTDGILAVASKERVDVMICNEARAIPAIRLTLCH